LTEQQFKRIAQQLENVKSTLRDILQDVERKKFSKAYVRARRREVVRVLGEYLRCSQSVQISGGQLFAWFAILVLCSRVLFARLVECLETPPEERTDTQTSCCTRFIQYLFRVVAEAQLEIAVELSKGPKTEEALSRERERWVNDIEYFAALTFMVAEYAHRQFGVSRAFEIDRHLQAIYTSEVILYTTKERYRDHLWHAVRVWLLGLVIGEAYDLFNKMWIHPTSSQGGTRLSKAQALENWTIAALFHDIGYALKIFEKIVGQVCFLQSPPINGLKENIRDTIDSEVRRFANFASGETCEFLSLKPASEELDHGVVSYSHLHNILGSYADGAADKKAYEPALRAIAQHNRFDEPVAWKVDPISVLLILCDELQEWKREQVEPRLLQKELIAGLSFDRAGSLPRTRFVKDLNLSISFFVRLGESRATPKCSLQPDTVRKLKISMRYEENWDRETGEFKFHVPYVWLSRSRNFQRADLTGFPLSVMLIMIHPVHDDLVKLKQHEWELLKEFCDEKDDDDQYRFPWIERWIDDARVRHKPLNDGSQESLTLRISELSHEPKLLFRSAEDILKGYEEWRNHWPQKTSIADPQGTAKSLGEE